jgi:SAM-dependent methyltransferase
MEAKFRDIYSKNKWGGSGTGSKFTADNEWFLKNLRETIDDYSIKSIADVGCGDWGVMKHMIWKEDEKYMGLDCVDFLIDGHKQIYTTDNVGFKTQDISTEIPSGYDLVIIKDVIQHWEDDVIIAFLQKLLQKNKYVYCVNGYKFMRDKTKNNWKKRVLDSKYHYHPIKFTDEPFTQFLPYIKNCDERRAKQYITFSLF